MAGERCAVLETVNIVEYLINIHRSSAVLETVNIVEYVINIHRSSAVFETVNKIESDKYTQIKCCT